MEKSDDFGILLEKVINKAVWDFRLGESSGSIISFECGDRLERPKGKNKFRKYEGECSFMIYCSWRICVSNEIITSWKDDIDLLKEGVLNLDNLKITNISLNSSYDISIEFEGGYTLNVFCDLGINNTFDCNWFFRNGQTYYSMNNKGGIDTE